MKDKIERTIVSVFVVALGVLVVVALVAVHNIRASIASSDWVNHTHAVILEGDAILTSLHAGEAALRNYLITSDPRDQGAYRTAYSEMVEHLEVAKALTRREKPQHDKFLQVERLLEQRVRLARELVQAAEQDGLEGARKQIAADAGGEVLREVQYLVRKLKEEQNVLLRERDKASYLEAQATRWTVLGGVGLNFLLLGFAGWLIRDDLAARRRAAAALEEANAQLEAKVRERTAELVEANTTLKKENLERQWTNQALTHQLRYSDLIISGISDLVFVVSKAQNISRLNPAVLRATQLDTPDLVGQPLDKVLESVTVKTPDGATAASSLAQALKEGREIQDAQALLRRKDGSTLPVRFSLVPLRDQNKVVGGIITARPTTPVNL